MNAELNIGAIDEPIRRGTADLEFCTVNPIADAEWDEVVQTCPGHTIFHTSNWAKVLSNTYSHRPVYLIFTNGERLKAIIPMLEVSSPITGRRGVGLPFTDSCEPLVWDGTEFDSMQSRVSEVALSRGWKHWEIRSSNGSSRSSALYLSHSLDLDRGAFNAFSRFSSSVRRAIRKASKSGVTIRVTSEWEGLLEYYRLHIETRRRHGLPPQPISFFRNIQADLLKRGFGLVAVAYRGGRAIAGAVFLSLGTSAIYKFGASLLEFQEFRANNLVMWESIKMLADRGISRLSFGRTAIGNDSLRKYKMGWGTSEERLDYTRIDPSTGKPASRGDLAIGWHNQIFRRMPSCLNRIFGTLIYKHLD
jgi:hypothetical protein